MHFFFNAKTYLYSVYRSKWEGKMMKYKEVLVIKRLYNGTLAHLVSYYTTCTTMDYYWVLHYWVLLSQWQSFDLLQTSDFRILCLGSLSILSSKHVLITASLVVSSKHVDCPPTPQWAPPQPIHTQTIVVCKMK